MDRGDPLKKRYGHTTTLWDGKLVVVGGSKMYNRDMKRRECMNDIQIYDPVGNVWEEPIPNGAYFEPRRHHASCIVGNHMVVNGGLNDKDLYLNSTLAINIAGLVDKSNEEQKAYRWVQLRTENQRPGNVAYHACQLVVSLERYKYIKLLSLTSLPDIRYGKGRVPYEGIYYFGGRDEIGPNNDLYVMRIGRKPIEWIKPRTAGPLPPARYGHSMNYIPEKGILVVFGGRNDSFFDANNSSCLDDIWILVLERMEWCEWSRTERVGFLPAPRYSHSTAVLDKSLYIFGGIGDSNYCETRVYAIDMMVRTYGGEKIRFDRSGGAGLSVPTTQKLGALGELKSILAKVCTKKMPAVPAGVVSGGASLLPMIN